MTSRPESLTIVVMTYNRYPRLLRLLHYAASMQLPYPIEILDSSSDTAPSNLQERLSRANARHRTYDATIPPMHKLRDGLSSVSTPYVVQWADDDFLVPGSLAQGVQWLTSHPDYSVAHGQSVLLQMEKVGDQSVLGIMPYWQRAVLQDTAAERLRDQLRHHAVLNYSIHRTKDLMRHVDLCCRHDFGYTWAELALGALAVIQGKAMKMDQLYLAKETHAGTDAWLAWLRHTQQTDQAPDVFDWVSDESFAKKFTAFRDGLAEALSQQDGIAFSQAQDVVKEAFWSYLASVLMKKYQGRYNVKQPGLRGRLRETARAVPGLRKLWRKAQFALPHRHDALSLPALSQSSSRYHEDFLPIYQAMMSMAEEVASPNATRIDGHEVGASVATAQRVS